MINTIKKLTSELSKEKYDAVRAKVVVRDKDGNEFEIDKLRLVTVGSTESKVLVIELNG